MIKPFYFPLLTSFYCQCNQIKELDVRENMMLTFFNCGYNQLTSLDFSANTKLYFLYCQDNLLTADELNALFRTLNSMVKWEGGYGDKRIAIDPNPGADACNRSIATDKGWVFFQQENYITANPTAPENDAGRDDGGFPFSNWTPSAPMKSSGL